MTLSHNGYEISWFNGCRIALLAHCIVAGEFSLRHYKRFRRRLVLTTLISLVNSNTPQRQGITLRFAKVQQTGAGMVTVYLFLLALASDTSTGSLLGISMHYLSGGNRIWGWLHQHQA